MSYRITKDKFLSEEERREFIAKVGIVLYQNVRDGAMLLTLFYTGCRAQELLNIRYSDINPGESSIYIRGLKGSDDRDVTVPSWVMQHILQARPWDAVTTPDTAMYFPITYNRLVQIWQKLEMKKPIKSLRHTFAIELYTHTKDPYLVKLALGHRCISSTNVYLDFIYSGSALKKLKTLGLYGLPTE